MSFGLAKSPFARDLAGFDFSAQPSLDRAQICDLATGRVIRCGTAALEAAATAANVVPTPPPWIHRDGSSAGALGDKRR